MTDRVLVAVAVILSDTQILLSKRHDASHQGGKWEFPGGKVESDETVELALVREIHEELGLNVISQQPFIVIEHDYQDKQVRLDVRLVSEYSGQAEGKEGQLIQWFKPADLQDLDFPAANDEIVKSLYKYLTTEYTPSVESPDPR